MKTKTLRFLLLSIIVICSYTHSSAQNDSIFIEGPYELCVGECADYYLVVDGISYPQEVVWNIFNGQTYTGNPLFICFDFPGVWYIEAQYFDATGNIITAVIEVFVNDGFFPQIYSNASEVCPGNNDPASGCEKVCAGSTVTYFVEAQTSELEWIIEGAESYELNFNSATVTWGEPGTGTVTVIDNNYCGGANTLCVDILADPEASFTTSPEIENGILSICQGQTVYFQNTSQNAATYLWDFGLNSTSTETDPSYTYLSPGTFEVSLIAYNECLCSDTTTVTVEVTDAESPLVDCVGTICENETVTYTADASCGTYQWTVSSNGTITDGGGTGDDFVTIDWGAGPVGTIELIVENCSGLSPCLEPSVIQIPILSDDAEIEGPDKVCRGAIETYSIIPYEGTEFIWSVSTFGTILDGQGTNSITVEWFNGFISSNPHTVQVSYENCYLECGGSDILEVYIQPEFYATGPIEVCENSSSDYAAFDAVSNTNTPANWQVLALDGTVVWTSTGATATPSIIWSFGTGSYTLEASPQNLDDFCTETYEIPIVVVAAPPAPDAIVGETNVCTGLTYSYEVQASNLENTFRWEVNDGGTITTVEGQSINVSWTSAGPYELSVIQISTSGLACESAPLTQTLDAIPPFNITGTVDVCQDQTSTYSVDYYDQVVYNWTIMPADAGTIISDLNSNTIEVLWHLGGAASVNLDACMQNATFAVNVLPRPEPVVIHPTDLCPNETAPVQSTQPFSNYTWKDENGNTVSTAASPNIGPGYYQLVVEDQYGCIGDTTFYINGWQPSDISISTPDNTGICAGDPPSTLYALSTDAGYTYQWYQNGVQIAGATDVTYATADFGTYHVEITDVNGCTFGSNSITLFDFCGFDGVCNGTTCTFVTDCDPGTNVSFDIQGTAECNVRNYINTSLDFIPGTLRYDFGDPASGPDNISFDENPTHTYSRAGFFTVILTGQSPDPNNPGSNMLCWDAKVDTVLVAANFDVDNACPGEVVEFFDLSTFLPIASITNWEWNFGDPGSGADNISTDINPTHIYANEGTYDVTLTVTGASGCTATMTKSLEVYPYPEVNFEEPEVNCQGSALNFIADVPNNVTYVEWDFGDPSSGDANISELFDTYHSYENTGTYTVTLMAQSIYGCTNTFSRTITIEPNTLNGDISFSIPSPICEGDSTTLTAPPGGVSWIWSTGAITDAITVSEADVYGVTITDAEGCEYSPAAAVVDVNPAPDAAIRAVEYNDFLQPIAYYYEQYSACYGQDVFLEVIDNPNYSYTWSNGDSGTETEYSEARNNLLDPGTHDITLDITNVTTGCTNVASFEITIHPLPANVQITASNMGVICQDQETTFSVTSPDATLNYVWSNGEIGTSITSAEAGEYYVTAINEFGCETESNRITIYPGPDISKIPSGCHTRCRPDTICLPTIPGIVSYQWYFNGNPIAAPNGTMPELVAYDDGDYWLEMTDAIGCTLTSGTLTLELFDGFGSINGNVYFDVNDNGIIDGPDTLVSNVDVQLINMGTVEDVNTSDANGAYEFVDILATGYTLEVDTNSLPENYGIYEFRQDTTLVGCDMEIEINWLCFESCEVQDTMHNFSICPGDAVTYNGMTLDSDTSFTETYTSVLGCDSFSHVVVTMLLESTNNLQLETCENTTISYDGVDLSPGDVQDFTFTNAVGCDSTVTVSVLAIPDASSALQLAACENGTVSYEGVDLSPGDVQDFTLQSAAGCDSIVTVTVIAIPDASSALQLEACENGTVSYEGVDLSPGDVQDFTLQSAAGCDSIITVTVIAIPDASSALQLEACENGTVSYEGVDLSPGDVQDFTLQSAAGCDSIITVTVIGIPHTSSTLQLEACEGGTVTYENIELSVGEQMDFTLINASGCDSIVSVEVVAYPEMNFDFQLIESCPNIATGEVSVDMVSGGVPPYSYAVDGFPFQPSPDFASLSAGVHTVAVQDAAGCTLEVDFDIPALPELIVDTKNTILPCESLETTLEVQVLSGEDVSFQWEDGSTDAFLQVTEPGNYVVNISNTCETITQTIEVNFEDPNLADYLYVPNAFSPNDDGINDIFMAYPARDVNIEEFTLNVFDRWGNQLFSTDNPSDGWRGAFKSKDLKTGVYIWQMKAKVFSCGRMVEVERQGDVALLK